MALAGTWESGQAESISDDILHEAGIYGERLSAEALRFELYDLESRTAALRGKVAGMKKQYDRAKRLLRFDLIMAFVFLLLRLFCELLHNGLAGMMVAVSRGGDAPMFVPLTLIDGIIFFFRTLFNCCIAVFLIIAVYRLYRFFCVWDSRLSIRWCAIIKKPNLRSEIFRLEIELARWENRLRQLKQVRAAYCGQMWEEWQDVGTDTVHCTN